MAIRGFYNGHTSEPVMTKCVGGALGKVIKMANTH